MNNVYLKKIYNLLKNGEQFGYFSYWNYYDNKPYNFPCFHTVLYKHGIKPIFCWCYYGSSANKATLEKLNWIIKTIFQTTPEKFLLQYKTKSEYERFKIAINQCIENQNKLY